MILSVECFFNSSYVVQRFYSLKTVIIIVKILVHGQILF